MKPASSQGRGINGKGINSIPLPFIPLLLLLLLLTGCKTVTVSLFPPGVHGHTGNPPIVIDHGDHTEVIP